MTPETLEIRDRCRQNLIGYLKKAISFLPELYHPLILDMGCGTGVPAIALAEHTGGTIYAVDNNEQVIEHLKKKIESLGLAERIVVYQHSVFQMAFPEDHFDLVIAEGLLNVIGFKPGIALAGNFLKDGGYFIIHDEYRDQKRKLNMLQKNGYTLIGSVVLDEQVWWNEYYQCLEFQLQNFDNEIVIKRFGDEFREIAQYKQQPGLFRSAYYILKK